MPYCSDAHMHIVAKICDGGSVLPTLEVRQRRGVDFTALGFLVCPCSAF